MSRKYIAAILWMAAIFLCAHHFFSKLSNPVLSEEAPVSALQEREDKIRICFWNVKNYIDSYRYAEGKRYKAPKPESEKLELVKVLKELLPDIIGIAEIGGLANLAEFRKILTEAGLDYPYFIISGNDKEYPQCAILSRFPIKSSNLGGKTSFFYSNEKRVSPRGLTVAEFDFVEGGFSFCVLHLKSRFGSKKADPDFSDFRIRECEAFLKDIKNIRSEYIIIAGDFNDEPSDKAPRLLIEKGRFAQAPQNALPTYIWKKENKPYVFDFFLVNAPALKFSEAQTLGVNEAASDHAPIFLDFDPSQN